MAIRLEKGENHKIEMDVFHVGLGWDVRRDASSTEEFDLDVSAFMIGDNKKLIGDDYLVFYGSEKRLRVDYKYNPNTKTGVGSKKLITPLQIEPYTNWDNDEKKRHESRPTDPEMSVIGSIDDEDGETSDTGDDETMDIDLSKIRPEVKEIIIAVSIYDYSNRHQNFGQVENAFVRLYKSGQEEGEGEYIYDLTEDFSTCTAVEFCRLYRHNGAWKVQALGVGHKDGLQELVNKFQ